MQASNRTNELDVNSVVTRETFKCGECGKVTSFEVFRVPEYTRNGQTALSRNVKYSDGTMMDGVGKGDCMDGVPGKDAYYTGYHYTKAVCETCGGINTNEPKSDYGYLKNVYWLFDCAAEFTQKLEETVTYEYTDDTYHTVTTKGDLLRVLLRYEPHREQHAGAPQHGDRGAAPACQRPLCYRGEVQPVRLRQL